MKILYLTNIHNPYRDEFFEQLGLKCDLTVLFEERCDSARDGSWSENAHAQNYQELFLPDGERGPISPVMLNVIGGGWSLVVVGCYNSPKQMVAIEHMRNRHIPYVVNLDGPLFSSGNFFKSRVRRHFLKGANAYAVAGAASVGSVRREVGNRAMVAPYPFSSVVESQLTEEAADRQQRNENLILCVGQFLPYKGIEVLLDAFVGITSTEARLRIIGAGKRDDDLWNAVRKHGLSDRVETVSFVAPSDLVREYRHAGLLVLPSVQECWGLVVNEAAACGCPIVSTWGSGAAIEFLSSGYPQYLAEPGSAESLALVLESFLARPNEDKIAYSNYLRDKAASYTIENMVSAHLELFAEVLQ